MIPFHQPAIRRQRFFAAAKVELPARRQEFEIQFLFTQWVKQCVEDFSAYVTNLTTEEAAFQIVELYRQRADAENVFDELKKQWGFSGFCSQKAAVSQSSSH